MTARSDRDLTPESIIQKVSDASGSKYSGGPAQSTSGPPPPVASKPAFQPTRSSAGGSGFNPLASSRLRSTAPQDTNVDEDGWGADAPQVTLSQLEKVQSSYQPTKVDMRALISSKPDAPAFDNSHTAEPSENPDIVKGVYQPIGKVDIAELRRQATEKSNANDDRPTVVKGSYEPVGKVDIAAIRARAQPPSDGPARSDREVQKPLPDRSVPFSSSERITSLPKPKVANRFGSGASSFAGTKAPSPGSFGLESKPAAAAPPLGVGRTFAEEGGKTPAKIWAEKKARERGLSGAGDNAPAIGGTAAPMVSQTSGGAQWKSGYAGKSWAPVGTTKTGQSSTSAGQEEARDGDEGQEDVPTSSGSIGAIRDRFKGAPPMGAGKVGSIASPPRPPPLDTSSKPNAGRGIPMPGLPARPSQPQEEEDEEDSRMPPPPAQPPRSPTPPTPPAIESGSPIRVAMPVGRGHNDQEVEDAREEQFSPPPVMPVRSLAHAIPHEDDLTEEDASHDLARGAGAAAAVTSFGGHEAEHAHPGAHESGKRALVQYDYEKAEDNELELKEGEYVSNIEMVDDDWWMGENPRGETGLFPSNYVELVEGNAQASEPAASHSEPQEHAAPSAGSTQGATATAQYDYEAAEGNELSFPENAKITNVVCSVLPNIFCSFNHVIRNFPTMIGGQVSTAGNLACSPPTM